MTAPILVDRFTPVPRYNRIDWSRGITRGLKFYVICDGPRIPRDLVSGADGVHEAGQLDFVCREAGWLMEMSTSGRINYGRTLCDTEGPTSQGTIAAIASPYTNGQASQPIGGWGSSSVGVLGSLNFDDVALVLEGLVRGRNNGNGGNSGWRFLPAWEDLMHLCAVSWDTGGTTFRAQGGEKATDADATASNTHSTSDTFLFSHRHDVSTTGRVRMFAVWDRPLSDDEWRDFEDDPDLRERHVVPVFTFKSGAVAPVTGAIADGAKAGDSYTATMTLQASVTEGISAGDTDTNVATLLAALTEGVKAGETWAGAVAGVLSGAVTEGTKAGDTYAAVLAALASASEGTKAGDTFASTLQALASVSEGAVAGDAVAVVASLQAALTEGVKVGDTWVGVNLSTAVPGPVLDIGRFEPIVGRGTFEPHAGPGFFEPKTDEENV